MKSPGNIKISFRQLQNGTKCYIIYKKGYKMKEAMFSVNFGSGNGEVIPGTAHFLEHKVFEQKEMDVFREFSAKDASVNAFTNFNTTSYYFTCSDFFEDNLKTLLDFTADPFFTDESIEREKGIIGEEIKMYEDDPWWQVYFDLIGALYSKNPIRNNIAGTIEDISKIDCNILMESYNRYYCGENSALIICGDVDVEKTFAAADKLIRVKQGKRINKAFEPDCIVSHNISKKMAVSLPIFNLGYREVDFDLSPVDRLCSTGILLNIILGKSSEIYEKLYLEGIIDKDFSMEYLLGDNYGVSVFSGVSARADIVAESVIKRIGEIQKNGISDEELESSRKQLLTSFELGLDSMEKMTAGMSDYAFRGISFEDIYNKYNEIKKDEVMRRLSVFTDENKALSLIEPN